MILVRHHFILPGSVNCMGPLPLSSAYRYGCTNRMSQRSVSDAGSQVRKTGSGSASPAERRWEQSRQCERKRADIYRPGEWPQQRLGERWRNALRSAGPGSLHLQEPGQEGPIYCPTLITKKRGKRITPECFLSIRVPKTTVGNTCSLSQSFSKLN